MRFLFLLPAKWRLPARERMTLPLAVILNGFATAFCVFGGENRAITYCPVCKKIRGRLNDFSPLAAAETRSSILYLPVSDRTLRRAN